MEDVWLEPVRRAQHKHPDSQGVSGMTQNLRAFATAAVVLAATLGAEPAWAQKSGGILKMYDPDSPARMSILEEGTVFAEGPMMGVFNNLVMYDQHVPQDSLQSIVPDLAT